LKEILSDLIEAEKASVKKVMLFRFKIKNSKEDSL
jgi:hypothetical protein